MGGIRQSVKKSVNNFKGAFHLAILADVLGQGTQENKNKQHNLAPQQTSETRP